MSREALSHRTPPQSRGRVVLPRGAYTAVTPSYPSFWSYTYTYRPDVRGNKIYRVAVGLLKVSDK